MQPEDEGQRTNQAEDHPEQGNEEEAISYRQLAALAEIRQP